MSEYRGSYIPILTTTGFTHAMQISYSLRSQKKSSFAACVALLVLSSPAFTQGGDIQLAMSGEAWAEDIARTFAQRAGLPGLQRAIENGKINVFPGQLPAGMSSLTILPAAGTTTPPIIVVPNDGNPIACALAAAHEYSHFQNGDTPVDPNFLGFLSPQQVAAAGCNELEAHCAALKAAFDWYVNTGRAQKIPCVLRNHINRLAQIASRMESLMCSMAAKEPVMPDPCGYANMPCQ